MFFKSKVNTEGEEGESLLTLFRNLLRGDLMSPEKDT